jgi:hypothetical protein
MAQTNQNGARAKILRALITNGMLTTVELAQQTGLTAQQVRDNANAAVSDRLVIKGKDCVTGSLGYQITALGRLWNDGKLQNARATLSATTGGETAQPSPEAGAEPTAEISQTLTDFVTDDLDTRRSYIANLGKMDSTTVHHIDVTEPAQPPEQYAICRSGQAHLSAWLLRDMSLDTAKQLAVDDAVATHGEVVLYRCTPIGRAVPRIVFEDA